MTDDKNTALEDQQKQPEANPADPEDKLSERLRALEAESEGNKASENKRSPAVLVAGLVAICGLGLAAYTVSQPGNPDRSNLETGQPDDFQTVGNRAYGDLMMPASNDTAPQPAQEPGPAQAPNEPDPRFEEMERRLAALQAEIAARDAADEMDGEEIVVDVPADDPRVSEMAAELEALRIRDEERQAEATRIAQEHARELQRLQSDLDLAQLTGSGGFDTSGNPMLDDRARQAEEARRRALEQQERRRSSGMIAFGRSGGGGGEASGAAEQQQARLSSNEQFVRDAGRPAQVERAAVIVNPSNTVTQGTMIQAILETAINSQLPGAIRGVVSEDVHSYDGTRILIPRGSVVIGKYSEGVQLGQRRALVAWERIIMPDNQSVTLSAYGGDQLGQSGLTGRVNTHFGRRFGSAALISFLSILPAVATENTDDDRANDMANRVGQNLSNATSSVLSESLRIQPTIQVPQGSRVTIMVDRDLEIF